ncbi:MAG TPA: POTRA domain-containing protein [Flavisolibacter sp.]|jgi:outer membrane protein assembly factor BamA
MRRGLPVIGFCVMLLSLGNVKAQEAFVNPVVIYSTNSQLATAQTTDTIFTIKEIIVTGNKRTRRSTILRELPFKTEDSYPYLEISEKLELTKRQLMNTNLFRNVIVNLQSTPEQQVFVSIDVEEKWYFFPQPFLRIANGTFSQWNERGRPMEHLNYGLKLTQFNFSGRGDKAHLHLANGYTKKIALQYQGFYFDKDLKWAGNLTVSHGKNRELNYITENNKVLAVKNPDGYLYEFFQGSFDLVYRPAIKTRHQFSIGYHHNRIGDTVIKLNENYSPASTVYSYPYISYGVSFIDYDFNPYPTKGRYGDVSIYKAGIGSSINLWQLSARGINYWSLGKRAYFSVRLAGMLKLPFKQPYITQQFMGYGDAYLQGYENYIIDGVAGAYSKQTLGYNLIKTDIPLPTIKLFKSLRSVPLRVYVKAYTNEGYVHNPNPSIKNGLNNRMLYSSGLGLDIVMFTDLIFKFEWSFNQLGQNGLYLHQ